MFARDLDLIDAIEAAGFRPGMTPGPMALGSVENLGLLLLWVLDRWAKPFTVSG